MGGASCRGNVMPKILRARPPCDDGEEQKIRKLAGSAMPRRTGASGPGSSR